VSAFGIADLLDREWDQWDKTGWATVDPPKVTMVTFAGPRVGNVPFLRRFQTLGIRALRITNKGDIVPKVPGERSTRVCILSYLAKPRTQDIGSVLLALLCDGVTG